MKITNLFLLTFLPFLVSAQTESEIRKHYQEANKQITQSFELGFEGPLYQNQLVVNKTGRSWPAVGIYADTTNFWYDDDPNHLSPSDRNPKIVLMKVTSSSRRAADVWTRDEYLYKNGALLFYYSYWGEEDKANETRVYFNSRGLMIKSLVKINGKEITAKDMESGQYSDVKPVPISIIKAGKRYQDLFLRSMDAH